MYKRTIIQKLIDQVVEIIKQPEADTGLKKKVLGNFQNENLCDHNYLKSEVKNGVDYEKRRVLQLRFNKIYWHLFGIIIKTVCVIYSSIIKSIHIF